MHTPLGEIFNSFNRLISKLVHPTAFSIVSDLEDLCGVELRETLLLQGQLFTEMGLKDLVAYFDSVGINSRHLRPEGK